MTHCKLSTIQNLSNGLVTVQAVVLTEDFLRVSKMTGLSIVIIRYQILIQSELYM